MMKIKPLQGLAIFLYCAQAFILSACTNNPLGKVSSNTSGVLCIGTSTNLNCDDTGLEENPSLSLEQGPSQNDPTNNPNIVFIATFSQAIDPASFTVTDIVQLGTAAVSWNISDNGSSKDFTLTATALNSGTIVPFIGQGAAITPSGASNQTSTSIDNSVTFDSGVNPPSNITHSLSQLNSPGSPPSSWTASPDNDIAYYQLAIGSTGFGFGQNDLLDWIDVGTATNHPGFTDIEEIIECTDYYTSLRAIDTAGNISEVITTPSAFSVDFTAPSTVSMLSISSTFAKTNQTPKFTWLASNDNCAFDRYEFALGSTGTDLGQNDIMDWTDIGTVLSFTANSPSDSNFTLNHGVNYFASIRAKDSSGNTSATTTSDPWQLNYNYAKFTSTTTTSGSNLNANTSSPLEWSAEVLDDAVFAHNDASAQDIIFLKSGNYLAQLTLPMESNVQRSNVRVDFYLDGALVQGGRSESAYIRNASNHTEASNHVHFLIPSVMPNQTLRVEVSQQAASGTVNITDQASLVLNKLPTDHHAFSALASVSSGGSNFNMTTPQALLWDRSADDVFDATTYTHNSGDSSISLNQTGDYLLYFNLPLNDPNGNRNDRTSVRAEIKINGVSVGFARQGYLRRGSGHNESSIHWAGIIRNININDNLTVELARDTSVSQAVNISIGQTASLFIQHIQTPEYIDLSGSTLNNGNPGQNNLNQSGHLEWTTQNSIDSSTFNHNASNNSDNITINQNGDYYIVFNTTLTSTVQRANPIFTLHLNGAALPGHECKSNYIRSQNNHNHASCSMVTLLHDLQVGDTLSIKSELEAASGTVTASFPNNLLIWKRP
ncbi:MAG TPA: hypothetical protein PKC21_04890 [Oligoflexia bacterium]|nr:hypothetical protein [Oligoflexia bacterium]HMR24673.1 hypothetical protein [Oligoflexia bacterium]